MVLATERKEWRCIFQVSFSGSQLGLGPREAGIYVLPLIILADIFQTSPADTVLTRAKGWAVSPGDTCEQGQLPWRRAGLPWRAAGSGTGASRQAALWQSPYVSHTPAVSLARVQGITTQDGGRRETTPRFFIYSKASCLWWLSGTGHR